MSLDAQVARIIPLTGVADLVRHFEAGAKRNGQRLLGLEHEKFLYGEDGAPLAYEGPAGIGEVFRRLEPLGWIPVREREGAPVIAMRRGRATLSLEPGGQFELSGTPFLTARDAHAENVAHLAELGSVLTGLKARAVFLGYRPVGTTSTTPWMPKGRYTAMRESLGSQGSMALHMMLMTATGQVSLDYADEADAVELLTLSARLAPVLVALFANSALVEGRPSGFASFRSRVWNDVDPARCGYPDCYFDGSLSFARYVEWALDAPLLFLRRGGKYLAPRLTFRNFLRDGFEGEPASESDWVDHVSTLFPEVRLKQLIELRSADCVAAPQTGALVALARGLLYDAGARAELSACLPAWSKAKHLEWHHAAQVHGLQGEANGVPLLPKAREVVAIAARGLKRIDAADLPVLAPLEEVARSGRSPSAQSASTV